MKSTHRNVRASQKEYQLESKVESKNQHNNASIPSLSSNQNRILPPFPPIPFLSETPEEQFESKIEAVENTSARMVWNSYVWRVLQLDMNTVTREQLTSINQLHMDVFQTTFPYTAGEHLIFVLTRNSDDGIFGEEIVGMMGVSIANPNYILLFSVALSDRVRRLGLCTLFVNFVTTFIQRIYMDRPIRLYTEKGTTDENKTIANRCYTKSGFMNKPPSQWTYDDRMQVRAYDARLLRVPRASVGEELENADIDRVMKKYVFRKFPTTLYIGPDLLAQFGYNYSGQQIGQTIQNANGMTCVMMIIHHNGHWTAMFMDLTNPRIEYFDSLGINPRLGEQNILPPRVYQLVKFMRASSQKWANVPIQWSLKKHQDRGNQCGMYVIWYAINRLAGSGDGRVFWDSISQPNSVQMTNAQVCTLKDKYFFEPNPQPPQLVLSLPTLASPMDTRPVDLSRWNQRISPIPPVLLKYPIPSTPPMPVNYPIPSVSPIRPIPTVRTIPSVPPTPRTVQATPISPSRTPVQSAIQVETRTSPRAAQPQPTIAQQDDQVSEYGRQFDDAVTASIETGPLSPTFGP